MNKLCGSSFAPHIQRIAHTFAIVCNTQDDQMVLFLLIYKVRLNLKFGWLRIECIQDLFFFFSLCLFLLSFKQWTCVTYVLPLLNWQIEVSGFVFVNVIFNNFTQGGICGGHCFSKCIPQLSYTGPLWSLLQVRSSDSTSHILEFRQDLEIFVKILQKCSNESETSGAWELLPLKFGRVGSHGSSQALTSMLHLWLDLRREVWENREFSRKWISIPVPVFALLSTLSLP